MAGRNIIAALVLIGIGTGYGMLTAVLPTRPVPNTPGPSFFPWLITAALLTLSFALLGRGVLQLRSEGGGRSALSSLSWRPVVALLWFAAYVAALPHAGFLIAGIPFFAGMMVLYGGRNPLVVALTAAAVPVALFFLFRQGFQIMLPQGTW